MVSGSWFQVDGHWYEKEHCPVDWRRKMQFYKKDVCQKQNKVAEKLCRVEEAQKDSEGQNHSEICGMVMQV